MRLAASLICSLFLPLGLAMPNGSPAEGAAASGAERRIDYEVSSGTWMSVDVSPDGLSDAKYIVADGVVRDPISRALNAPE